MTPTPAALQLGFLSVLSEGPAYLGGYLVTNAWGRPLEFRVTSAVQPNRVQQILYAGTLDEFLAGELIGKSLVEKAASTAQLVCTDGRNALSLRHKIDTPVAFVGDDVDGLAVVRPAANGRPAVALLPAFAADEPRVRELLGLLDGHFDLTEPFGRVREAVAEARRLGGASRGAA